MEGAGGSVSGVCEFGRRNGGWCDGVSAEVCGAECTVADDVYGGCEFGGEWVGYVEVSFESGE